MSRDLHSLCQWCRRQFSGRRKFCTGECRRAAQESKNPDPTEQEIRQMCCRIREEGGEAWERSHTCYTPQPYRVPVVSVSRLCFAGLEG